MWRFRRRPWRRHRRSLLTLRWTSRWVEASGRRRRGGSGRFRRWGGIHPIRGEVVRMVVGLRLLKGTFMYYLPHALEFFFWSTPNITMTVDRTETDTQL